MPAHDTEREAAGAPDPRSVAAPGRILIVRLGALGDVVRTLPAVRLLRTTWPGARIAWAVEPGPARLLAGVPDVDEFIVFDRGAAIRALRRGSPRAFAPVSAFVRALRQFRPDLAFDFQASFKSGLVGWLSRAPIRLGFDRAFAREASHLFANRRVRLAEARIHRVERAVALARARGAAPEGPRVADLGLTADERAAGRELIRRLAGPRLAIALAPFSSPRQAWKRYPVTRWGEVARGLAAAGHAVILDLALGQQIRSADRTVPQQSQVG